MDVNELIKNKLSQYLSKEISKEDLYNWALGILHNILDGDILKITYLKVWEIISGLASVDDMDDFYCDEMARQFSGILSGNESGSFTFAFRIPTKFVVEDLLQMEVILRKYLREKQLSEEEILELKLAVDKECSAFQTLNEFLKLQIIDLINLGSEFYDGERDIEFDIKSTVFISEEVSMSLADDFLEKIITLLECYNGKRCFYVHSVFQNGVGNISIQV